MWLDFFFGTKDPLSVGRAKDAASAMRCLIFWNLTEFPRTVEKSRVSEWNKRCLNFNGVVCDKFEILLGKTEQKCQMESKRVLGKWPKMMFLVSIFVCLDARDVDCPPQALGLRLIEITLFLLAFECCVYYAFEDFSQYDR